MDKEIIFWFSSHKIKNYWLEYAIHYCKEKFHFNAIWYNRIKDWIQIGNLKILFKVDDKFHCNGIGLGNVNQYWAEELFDNNFEEFFISIIKQEIKNGEERRN